MALRFTQITAKIKYPPNVRGQLSTLHSDVITYVCSPGVFTGNYMQKHKIVRVLNSLSFCAVNGVPLPEKWNILDPITTGPEIEDDLCRHRLGELYIVEKSIQWDIDISDEDSEVVAEDSLITTNAASPALSEPAAPEFVLPINENPVVESAEDKMVMTPTAKEDLYIQSPKVPRFDVNLPWKQGLIDGTLYIIYTSEPKIPTTQTEISVTTNVDLMTRSDLMKLFPNRFIQTRASVMYTPIPKIPFHEKLGVILPIEGYSYDQVVDNIIRYPHIFRLTKQISEDQIASFYSTIEVNGELHNIKQYWYNLPESKQLPFQVEFLKEYVVRRYLLERDVDGVQHKFPINGSLNSFLTLFTTPQDYMEFGYTDLELLARQCVESRISYKQSRNPILRRLGRV